MPLWDKQRTAGLVRRLPWLIAGAKQLYAITRGQFTCGVVGVVFDAAGAVLIVEHVYHPRTPWGLPGGWVDHDEHPAHAVRRELREELSLAAEVGPVVALEKTQRAHLDYAFLCRVGGPVGTLSDELLGYRWAPPDALPALTPFHHWAIQCARRIDAHGMWEAGKPWPSSPFPAY